jgi:RNA polymerase sigma-70 factor (ECF subfamily)
MKPDDEFERLTLPLRRELVAYCYRMTGSADDAEDLAQETLLRAWRSYGTFEGRSSLRTWLYRIATNVCLGAIERRGHRPLPSGLGPPADDPQVAFAAAAWDIPWLQPFPSADSLAADPAAIVAARAGMRLALIASLQYLPPRQRAALILRDVLDWPAADTARMLGMTVTAVNSALRRARARLEQAGPAADEVTEPASRHDRDIATRYATAFQDADMAALVALLRADVVAEMPPMREWFRGAQAVGRFLATRVLTRPGCFTLIPVAANGQPAFGTYLRDGDGEWVAHAIQVLDIAGGPQPPAGAAPRQIARISLFLDPGLFPAFGLPLALPGAGSSRPVSRSRLSSVPVPSRPSAAARAEGVPCCSP